MKCQSLFSEKIKKNIINLSFAAFGQRVIKLNHVNHISLYKRFQYIVGYFDVHRSFISGYPKTLGGG